MSHEKLNQLVGFIAKKLDDNEKLATPVLAAKLAKCVEAFPHDQTVGAIATVIDKMAINNTLFIRKADLKSLYNKLYSRNTKFAELFQDELGLQEEAPSITTYKRDDAVEVQTYEVADPILANALTSAFDSSVPLKEYSQVLATKALKSVSATLNGWNLRPTTLDVENGNDKFFVLKANYETPKGITSILIPVEVHNQKVVEASLFMGNTGPEELNHVNIKNYLTSGVGLRLKVSASNVFDALNNASVKAFELSDAELALTKLNAKREASTEYSQNQIVGQEVDQTYSDVSLPEHKDFSTFEAELETPHGQAYWQHGASVTAGISYLNREITSFGFKNPQIAVSKSDSNTVYFSVAVDGGKIGFVVPVKVANNKVIIPTVMLCNGSIAPFNANTINELRVKNSSDFKAAATASPQFALKPSDLVNNIRVALAESNHSKAEDALNVLANSGDEKAYATGFQMYLEGLAGKKAEASAEKSCGCSLIIKSANSQHPVCGHTNLPIHKVYQDKHGNCLPLYRRDMDETYEGATFMNSKIFG
jgi:hypothetical protein